MRYWGKVDDSYILSPLVVNEGEGQVNGVLLEVNHQALTEFDRRERGYHRIQIRPEQIETDISFNPDHEIWVYVKSDPLPPCTLSPIMQSYVDTVLAGCLEVSHAFAEHFVRHTIGWQHAKENDRHQPKYGNLAGVQDHHYELIDNLIKREPSGSLPLFIFDKYLIRICSLDLRKSHQNQNLNRRHFQHQS